MIEYTAEQYVDDVLAGRIVTGRWARLACERHRRDLETGHERGLWFDEQAAKIVIAFYSVLRHWKGEWANKPVILEPCQQFWVWSLFGWKRDDGTRRFQTAYLEVARKNGKTTWAAGGGLFLGFVDGEAGAEIYSAATKKDQAKIVHNDATQMVKKSPQLEGKIIAYRNNLHDVGSVSKFEPLASDSDSLDGLNAHGIIADELHAWKGTELWGVLKTSTGSRRQPMMMAITTAGVDQRSICYQQREYVTRILKGLIHDDDYWGIIYTLDTKLDWPDLQARGEEQTGGDQTLEDDWQDESVWIKANPLLGVSKKWRTMRNEAREAKNKPSELNNFLRWQLNIWTQAVTRWVNPIKWAECGELSFDPDELIGRPCYAGLDLSEIYDLTTLQLVFPPEQESEPYKVLSYFWLPADNMYDRVRRDNVPYDAWHRMGYIELTPGNVVDYDFILEKIKDLAGIYNIAELGFDRWGASMPTQHMQKEYGDEWVVPIGQGYASMSPPMKELGKLVASVKLAHGNNPVLTWMADNLVAREDPAGNIKPDKEKSREKIDGMVALIMAIDRATRGEGGTVYEERGILVL